MIFNGKSNKALVMHLYNWQKIKYANFIRPCAQILYRVHKSYRKPSVFANLNNDLKKSFEPKQGTCMY